MKRPVVTVVPGGSATARGASARSLRELDDLGHDLRTVTVHALVSTEEDLGAVLDAVMRGATVSVEMAVGPAVEAAFLDELRRVADVRRAEPATLHPTTVALLGLLAEGATVEDAARSLRLSTGSAHRRLAEARRVLGVATTAEAVLACTAGGRVAPSP